MLIVFQGERCIWNPRPTRQQLLISRNFGQQVLQAGKSRLDSRLDSRIHLLRAPTKTITKLRQLSLHDDDDDDWDFLIVPKRCPFDSRCVIDETFWRLLALRNLHCLTRGKEVPA
jgi:hypothetical protein